MEVAIYGSIQLQALRMACNDDNRFSSEIADFDRTV